MSVRNCLETSSQAGGAELTRVAKSGIYEKKRVEYFDALVRAE